jgi:acyl-CoA thioesterase-1
VGHRGVFVALAAAVTTALLGVVVDVARAGDDTPRCDRFAAASVARAAEVTGAGADVLVIGDSYSAGLGLERPVESWPSRLPGRVHVAGFSGSGFSAAASPCGGRVSFAARAPEALRTTPARLVVAEGGLNDWDRPAAEIRAGFERLVAAVGDRTLVVVGPVAAPSRAQRVPAVDALLAALSAEHGVAYVSTTDLDLPYLDDRLHLTPAGHRAFGDAVAARLAAVS